DRHRFSCDLRSRACARGYRAGARAGATDCRYRRGRCARGRRRPGLDLPNRRRINACDLWRPRRRAPRPDDPARLLQRLRSRRPAAAAGPGGHPARAPLRPGRCHGGSRAGRHPRAGGCRAATGKRASRCTRSAGQAVFRNAEPTAPARARAGQPALSRPDFGRCRSARGAACCRALGGAVAPAWGLPARLPAASTRNGSGRPRASARACL
ncbi:MAG: High frequency lysogenization protein HflD, partial [uncultured Lysobacter sp.]